MRSQESNLGPIVQTLLPNTTSLVVQSYLHIHRRDVVHDGDRLDLGVAADILGVLGWSTTPEPGVWSSINEERLEAGGII